MKKKSIMSLLMLSGFCCAIPTAYAEELTDADFESYQLFMYDGLPYHVLDDGTVELCNVNVVKGPSVVGNAITIENVVIPAVVSYDGVDYNVTQIGQCAFQGCTSVKTVSIPEGVTVIGYQAFYNATNVEWPEMPSTLREIKGNCFYMCRALGKIVLPEGLTTLWSGCLTRTFDYGGSISELVFPGTLTTITDDWGNFATICSDRTAGTVEKMTFAANSDWADLRFSFNTFSRGVICKEMVINRDLVDYDSYDKVNLSKVTNLETIHYGAQVTKLPDMSGCTSLTTIYCDAPTPPSNLLLPDDALETITVIVPDAYLRAYQNDEAWAPFMPEIVESSPVDEYVDFDKIGYTVGEGECLGALMISWNDGPYKGVDNLIYGVRFDKGATAQDIIATVLDADSRLHEIDGGYAYDNLDKGEIVEEYDHYCSNDADYVWNVYSVENPRNGNVVYLCYEPVSNDVNEAPEQPKYPFYIPEETYFGAMFPENYEMPIADEMLIPVWAHTGGIAGVYAYFAWNASHFSVNTKGANQAAMAAGRPWVAVDFTYVDFNTDPDNPGIGRYVPQTQDDVLASVNLSTYGGSNPDFECQWSSKIPMKIVPPEKPITKITDKNINVAGTMDATLMKDLVDFEPADATYTRFFIEVFDENLDAQPLYRQDVFPAPYTDEETLYPGHEYWLGKWSVASGASDLILNLKYFYGLEETGENEYIQTDGVEGMLSFTISPTPVKAVALDGDYDGDIVVDYQDILALRTKAMPSDSNQSVSLSIKNATEDNIATCYNVSGGLPDGTNGKFIELVTYKAGEFDLVLTSVENSNITRSYHVVVNPPSDVASEDSYEDGTFWLNEDWYTHKNGSINYLKNPVPTSDDEIIYRAYGLRNDGLGFGATSQYAMIFADKLFVMSKQEHDSGDIRGVAGGRLVVADAGTLERLASFEDIGGDGRACVGVSSGKVYLGTNAGIRVLNFDDENNFTLAASDIAGIGNDTESGSTDVSSNQSLYNQQIGDMVATRHYVFAIQQGVGVHVIDAESDTRVKTISDTGVQGIVLSADGHVWYASTFGVTESGTSLLHEIDPDTTEEINVYTVPGLISCSWGSWRSTNFFATKDENTLFWTSASSNGIVESGTTIYRWNIGDDLSSLEPLYTMPETEGVYPGVMQVPYATMRYDDRAGCILFATTTSPSGNYRWNWYNFLNVETLELTTVALKPYYWFPAIPVFPDKYLPEFAEIDDIRFSFDNNEIVDSHYELSLEGIVTDRDNHDANIRLSVEPDNALSAICDVNVSNDAVSFVGKDSGNGSLTITAESNGRVVAMNIPVEIKDETVTTGVSDVEVTGGRIVVSNQRVYLYGLDGLEFVIYATDGKAVRAFRAEGDMCQVSLSLPDGVYVLCATDGSRTMKFVLK